MFRRILCATDDRSAPHMPLETAAALRARLRRAPYALLT